MTDQDDAALTARLAADATTLDADATAMQAALATPEGEAILVDVTEKLWPLLAPALEGAVATSPAGPLGAGALTVVLGAVKGRLDAKAQAIAAQK